MLPLKALHGSLCRHTWVSSEIVSCVGLTAQEGPSCRDLKTHGLFRKSKPSVQVYLASASPPVRFPNVYGVDLPTRREFVACDLSEDQIRGVLGADGLVYQSMADMEAVGQGLNPSVHRFEDSCFTGDPRLLLQCIHSAAGCVIRKPLLCFAFISIILLCSRGS